MIYGELLAERASATKDDIMAETRGYRLLNPPYPIIPRRLLESDRDRFRYAGLAAALSVTVLAPYFSEL